MWLTEKTMPSSPCNSSRVSVWISVVLPVPDGAERMNSSPRLMGERTVTRAGGCLLDVLDLLTHLLTEHLGVDHRAGELRIAGLGA